MFDKWGNRVDGPIPTDAGPAALVVGDPVDALKRVEQGTVESSVNRSQMWRVEAIVLNRIVVERLPDDGLSVDELLAEVRSMGLAWQIRPTSSP